MSVVLADGTATTHYGVPVSVATEFAGQAYKMGFYTKVIVPQYATSNMLKVGDIAFQPVASKFIKGISYKEVSKTLYLLGASGEVREFSYVPAEIYQGFLNAAVKNAYYVGYIENGYESRPYEDATEDASAEGAPEK